MSNFSAFLKQRRIDRLNAEYRRRSELYKLALDAAPDPEHPLYDWYQGELRKSLGRLRVIATRLQRET